MLLHSFVAIIIGCVIFNSIEVKGDDSILSDQTTLLDLMDSMESTTSMNPMGSTSSPSLLSLLNLPKLPNITNFIKELSGISPNATMCKLCTMNTGQLCKYYGYKSDSYNLITHDGYNLTIFRCYNVTTQKQRVLLVHGMMDSSDTWAMSRSSLAYNYVDAGYEVHMVNCRGNRYSRQHTSLSPEEPAFWNFSWTEMARYDIPQTIDAILKSTGTTTIQCVGHSQGGSVLLAMITMTPKLNDIVTHVGLLAPFTFMNKTGFPISTVIDAFFYEQHNQWEFLPHTFAQEVLALTACKIAGGALCSWGLNFILGPSQNQIESYMFQLIFCHFPAGCSARQLTHFGQEHKCQYFGEMMNVPPPMCNPPPNFDLTRITTALTLFHSPNDPHTNPDAVKTLLDHLKNAKIVTKTIEQFNHIDFVWGKNAHIQVYQPMIARAALFASAAR